MFGVMLINFANHLEHLVVAAQETVAEEVLSAEAELLVSGLT